MNWAWITSLEHLWRSQNLPTWLPLAAAGFFGLILLVTLLRAQKSVANVTLVLITLASIGADGILKIRDAKRGRLLASAQQAMRGVHAISFAADGRHLATAEASGTVRLWDAAAVKLARE